MPIFSGFFGILPKCPNIFLYLREKYFLYNNIENAWTFGHEQKKEENGYTMSGLFDNLRNMAEQWKREDEQTINSLRDEGLLDLNNGAWDDVYDVIGYNPPCPDCGFEMKYNWGAGLLQCPNCGKLIFDGDFDYSNMPEKEDIDFDSFYKH